MKHQVKSISDFQPRKKYIYYGAENNVILTFKQFQKHYTEDQILKMIESGKVWEM